jgi:clan AA aspartic protease (TIGR02281 family)
MAYCIAAFVLVIFASGCATTTTGITYYTDPPGAVISYKDGTRKFGASPIRLPYQWDTKYVENGCLKTKGITATWVDGTTASSPDVLRICGRPGEYEYKLSKPTSTHDSLSGKKEQKIIAVGEQLTSFPDSCLLYFDSVAVSPGQLTLYFYAYNDYDYIKGKFSVNAAYPDNNSEVHILGVDRSQIYAVTRKLNFIVVANTSVSSITLKTSCDGTANTTKIPLYASNIQDAIASFGNASNDKYGPNEIRLIKSGGVYEIPVVLNGVLTIQFIVDSGASDVSITHDVALTLLRTGTIAESDWLPGAVYQFADGSKAKSKRFRLKSVKIGDNVIKGVSCSISRSVDAPMLLGQSVLERLGEYTVDYKKGALIFE